EGVEGAPPADLAVLHVDQTVVPDHYLALAASYPRSVNGKSASVAKRSFSQQLLGPDDRYDGPVIIKTDANFGGLPELRHYHLDRRRGRGPTTPPRFARHYPVLPSLQEVPEEVRHDSRMVVERFVPERDAEGNYYLRCWVFFGDRERCTRYRARVPVIKARETLDHAPCEVPDAIRAWRERLDLDYGKLDFVIHEGEPILLDANRTPTAPAAVSAVVERGMAQLAPGLDALLG
ncbi:MAG: hypothetical protein KC731_22955, partial [Myxococcales bacterium]|nr:hypothetical protein [Myxococcales bacterium]